MHLVAIGGSDAGTSAALRARELDPISTVPVVVAGVLLWLVLVGSNFLVLEVVDLVFGSRVSLGGFIPMMLLIITLLRAGRACVGCCKVRGPASRPGRPAVVAA